MVKELDYKRVNEKQGRRKVEREELRRIEGRRTCGWRGMELRTSRRGKKELAHAMAILHANKDKQ